MEEMNDKLKQLALWLFELTNSEKQARKNILYENSNNNENWHSRILRMFLEYHENDSYPILDSFIDLLNKKPGLSINKVSNYTAHPRVECYNEWEHIDTLVRINNDALVIENKINWAVDQDAQIERYIKTIIQNPMIDGNNIYVIYLTSNGNKIVSDYSFTEEAKRRIGKNHFVPLNYLNDILPWLKDTILPQVDKENKILYSSILVYIDYLENMFKNESDYQITNKFIEKMEEKEIGINNLEECFNVLDGATKLVNELNKIKEQKIKDVAASCIITPLRLFLEEKDKQLVVTKEEFFLGYFNIEIKHQEWNKCCIHLGIWQYKVYGGLAYYDPKAPLSQDILNRLKAKFDGWKGDNNEPIWNYFKEYRDYYSLDAWKKIEKGEFVKYVEKFVEDFYDKIKDENANL